MNINFNRLAEMDWNTNIPYVGNSMIPPTITLFQDLHNLANLAEVLKIALHTNNRSELNDLKKIVKKCINFSNNLNKNTNIYQIANKICDNLLSYIHINKIDDSNDELFLLEYPFIIKFGSDETVRISEAQRQLLAQHSHFFKVAFENGFEYEGSTEIQLANLTKKDFLAIFTALENPNLSLGTLSRASYMHLYSLSNDLGISSILDRFFTITFDGDLEENHSTQVKKFIIPKDYKEILAQKSDFFRAFFYSQFKEKLTNTFHLSDIKQNIFEILIDNISHLNALSSEDYFDNLLDIYHTAKQLCFEDLVRSIEEKIEQHSENLNYTSDSSFKCALFFYKHLRSGNIQLDNCHLEEKKLLRLFGDHLIWASEQSDEKMNDVIHLLNEANIESLILDFPYQRNGKSILERLPLRNLTSLINLVLTGTQITDKDLQYLQGFSLKTLNLSDTKVTDKGLQYLQHLPLQVLNLSNTKEINWSKIADCLEGWPLADLNVSNTRITDDCLAYLKGSALHHLNLSGCYSISDTGMRYLAHLPLSSLVLNWTQISDKGLLPLRHLPLEHLSLMRVQNITENEIRTLVSHLAPTLKSIDLSRCCPNSHPSLIGLPNQYPNIEFEWDNPSARGLSWY
jgi:hypothetical protein